MWGHADPKDSKKRERASESEPAHRRETPSPLAPLFLCSFLTLGLPYVNWASQECCLFYPRSSLRSLDFLCSSFAGLSLLTLCNPIDCSPSGSPIPGILQARTLEWVVISISNAWKWKVKVKSLSRVQLFSTPWTAAHQTPLSMGFSRQEYWSGVPLPSPSLSFSHHHSGLLFPILTI